MTRASKPAALRLIAAANEVLAVAFEIEPRHGEPPGVAGHEMHDVARDDPIWLALARQTYRDRRRRSEIFGTGDLFGEPAWDMMLDLFIAAKQQQKISTTSACIGSDAPVTTALRWLRVLEEQGLVERESDSGDQRRTYVRLSASGYRLMVEYFAGASMTLGSGDLLQEQEGPGDRAAAPAHRH